MLDLKRWKTVTYQLPDEGGELVFDVKRPRAIEAHKFRLASMEMAASGIAAQDTLNRESEGLLLGSPEEEKSTFLHCHNVDLCALLDGVPR